MKSSLAALFSVVFVSAAVFVSTALCSLPLALAGSSTAGASGPALSASASVIGFGAITLGTYYPEDFTVTNTSTSMSDAFNVDSGLTLSGVGADDYVVTPEDSCPGNGVDVQLAAGDSCTLEVFFFPGALGARNATLSIADELSSGVTVALQGEGSIGYYQVDQYGDVANFGDAGYYEDAGSLTLNSPIVGITPTGDDGGYWLVARDGGIFTYGDAPFHGSAGGLALNKPVVGMAATRDQGGYWLVASDGGIFDYGDAPFFGSAGSLRLNAPIVGMAPTPDDGGYWLVASDGGIFSYGDAQFYGSTGSLHLNAPIVGMAPTPDGGGYWLVASDGGIFSYGDAQFYGSTGSIHLNQPIVAMAAMPDGGGYWFTAADGGLFNYGDAPFYGSSTGQGLGTIVDMATDGAPTAQAQEGFPAIRHNDPQSLAARVAQARRFAGPRI